MKKFIVIAAGLCLLLLLLSPLAVRHYVRSSPAIDLQKLNAGEVHKLFTGNWAPQGSWGELVLHSSGHFQRRLRADSAAGMSEWLYEGTWDVQDEFLTLTITNVISRNTTSSEIIGKVDRFKITSVDKNHVVLEKDGVKNYFAR